MKKLISGLVAAFLLSAGFVAVSAETASAACAPTKYVECQASSTKPTGPKTIKAGKKPKTKVSVNTQGAVKAKGTVTVTYTGPGGFKKTIKATVVDGKVSVTGPALKKPGKYKVAVVFTGDNVKDSKGNYTITVKKKK
jgi:hypothetical protein